jgi:LysR family transcriptional regulator, hydrogen peroxide-inducible genes activator
MTRAIQMLEKEFGGSLFDRQRTSVHLTNLGKLIHPYLEEVWQKSSIAKRVARDYAGGEPKQLTLGIMCTIAPKLLIQLLDRFRSAHPELQLRLVDGRAQLLEERLLNFQIEAAIYCRPDQQPDVRLNYLPLFREQMMIVLPKEHRLSKYGSIKIGDLVGEHYIQRAFCEFADIVNFHEMLRTISDANDGGCDVVYTSDRDDWVQAMVASGFGFGFLPEHSINHDRIISRPMIDPYWRNVHLVTAHERLQSPAVGALVHEAMRTEWANERALAITAHLTAD